LQNQGEYPQRLEAPIKVEIEGKLWHHHHVGIIQRFFGVVPYISSIYFGGLPYYPLRAVSLREDKWIRIVSICSGTDGFALESERSSSSCDASKKYELSISPLSSSLSSGTQSQILCLIKSDVP
jgi:hypothetical protein